MKANRWAEIRNRLSRTTRGDWHKCDEGKALFSVKSNFDLVTENLIEEDADFLEHVKQDMAELLAENAQLTAIVEKVEAYLECRENDTIERIKRKTQLRQAIAELEEKET